MQGIISELNICRPIFGKYFASNLIFSLIRNKKSSNQDDLNVEC